MKKVLRASCFAGALLVGAPQAMHAQDSTTGSPAPLRPCAVAPVRPCARPSVRLTFTGDINLGTSLLEGGVPSDTLPSPFAQVDSLLDGDLVIGNFEGAFSDTLPAAKCGGKDNCYEFRTPRWMVRRLVEAGFTTMNQANNHASDLGVPGRDETRQVMDSVGIQHYGILGEIAWDTVRSADCEVPVDSAGTPAPRTSDFALRTPCSTVVATVGFTTYEFAYNLLHIDSAKAVVDSVAKLADIVVVTFHGGAEGKRATHVKTGMDRMGGEKRGDLRRFTHAMIDAGADIVVGHGPHVLRAIEFYRGHPIAYSMGNFVTWHGFNMTGVNGLTGVLQVELNSDGSFASGRFVPLRQVKWVGVVPDRSLAALTQVRRLTRTDFPRTGARLRADGTISAPSPLPGRKFLARGE